MSGRAILRLVVVAGGVAACCACLDAAPPWSNLISFDSVEADPHKVYVLSDSQGPWLVMACTSRARGREAGQRSGVGTAGAIQAAGLCPQARNRPWRGGGRGTYDRYGNLRRWEYQKYKDSKDREKARHPELAELAVLVGNYQSIDDPTAQETLRKIKFAQPKCLEIKDGQADAPDLDRLAVDSEADLRKNRQRQAELRTDEPRLHHAQLRFCPRSISSPCGLDTDVIALNRGVPYSLLDCPGKFTVQVATANTN